MKHIFVTLFVLYTAATLQADEPYYYFKQISIKEGLPSSVTSIYNDEDGFLWIGTIYGIYRFDGEKLTKLHFSDAQQISPYTYEISGDGEGHIWAFTTLGASSYNPQKDTLEPLLINGSRIKAYTGFSDNKSFLFPIEGELLRYDKQLKTCSKLPVRFQNKETLLIKMGVYDDEYYIGLSSKQELMLIDRQTGETRASPFKPASAVWNFYRDSRNRYWLSRYGEGIACYTLQGQLIDLYTPLNSGLNNRFILDIEERNGQIWLATDGGGINIIHPDSRQITTLTSQNNHYFPANSVTCLSNGANNMWVGMVREGVLGAKENFITTYSKSSASPSEGMSEKCPLCLIEDEDGILWIGTDGGGVNSFHPQTETFTHYPSTEGKKIVSLCPYSKDELLISDYLTGIQIFDKKTGACRKFTLASPDIDAGAIGSSVPINLFINKQGEVEFHGKVYCRYLKEKNRFIPLNIPSTKYDGTWDYIGYFHSKPYYHNQYRIFRYNHKADELEPVYGNDGRDIIAACIDSTGTIWIANRTDLNTFNVNSGETETLRLPDNKDLVTSLVSDRQGSIWMGTPGALYLYSPMQKHFVIFSESDGVIPNDFLPKPVLNARNNDIYMGGVTGLVRVKKSGMQRNKYDDNLRIKLLDVRLNGRNATVHDKGGMAALEIARNFTQIEIHTKLDGTDLFRKRIYRYRIVGLNNGDYTESAKSYLNIPALPSGDYQIDVQCTGADGQWSKSFTLLQLIVLPPWWQRTWIIVLAALLTLSALAYVIHLREVKIQRKLKEKERQIYKDKVQALINVNHELRTPLTLIYSPLKQLLNSKQIPLELRDKLLGAFKQARQMKNIINMILNIRRMEVGQYTLCPTPTPLNEWLENIISDFRSEFGLRNISLQFNPDPEISTIPMDTNPCEIIISNLLINAYKFSPHFSVITVSTHLEKEHDSVCIEVRDQGMGLGDEDPQKLFTRFQRGHHSIEGNGIGLSYAKQLIEMHGGQISAGNNEEKGATFRFTLPASRNGEEQVRAESTDTPSLNDFLPSAPITAQKMPEAQPEKYHSILIAEGDPDLRDFMAANLQSLFEHTYTAHDGMEALPIIVSQLPQLIISDVSLPRINGLELCRKVKQNPETSFIPVILLAPDRDEVNAEGGYKTGADAYVAKPFDIDLLTAQIQAILRNRNIMKQRYRLPVPISKASGSGSAINHLEEQFLIRLNQIVADNLCNADLDVNKVAKLMRMSRASLYNKMKAAFGIGVNEYITKQRIEHAKSLLAETDLNISDISERAGFLHARNFSVLFKAATGYSPSNYRKKQK